MLSTAVISLMYCSIQTRKRGLTADRENNMWRYLDGVSAPPAKKKKSEAVEKQAKYEKEERRRAFFKLFPFLVIELYMILIHNDRVLIVEVFEVLSLDENPTRSEVHDYNCLFVLNGVRMFLCC